jgi:hypothetical protein
MTDRYENGVHWSFWAISIFMLIWNVMGSINFFAQRNPEVLAGYRESERAIVEGRPGWATAAFAIAVFGGALGCLLLLLRNSNAFYLFVASLLGVVVTMIHTLGVGISFGIGKWLGIILMPLAVGALSVWYSKWAERKGWLTSKIGKG